MSFFQTKESCKRRVEATLRNCMILSQGVHGRGGGGEGVIERPYTMGGGVSSPPPPQTKVTIVGKSDIYR